MPGFPYIFPFTFDDYIRPVLRVYVAFGSDPMDATPVWTEITDDVMRLKITRGRQTELDRMEAGTATLVLKNIDGNYWPGNTGSDYYPNVVPGKRIQIRAVWEGTVYYLFTGFVQGWPPSWLSSMGGKGPITTLRCSDLINNLSRYELNDGTGYSQELSGTRVGNVLDDIGWPAADRDIDAGQSQMIATGAIADAKAMAHLFIVEESELGIIYIAGDGDVQFEDRHHRLKSPHTTSQATFGSGGGELPYQDLEPDYDEDFIFNDIRITRSGGTQQVATDSDSQTNYGKKTHGKTDLLIPTDNEALDQANYKKKRYASPALRVRRILVMGDADPSNLWVKVLGLDISDRITLNRSEASIAADYHIEGVTHEIDLQKVLWKTYWELSDADEQIYWALGVTDFSELGEATYLAY